MAKAAQESTILQCCIVGQYIYKLLIDETNLTEESSGNQFQRISTCTLIRRMRMLMQ